VALSHWQARGDPGRHVQVVVSGRGGEILYLSSGGDVANLEKLLEDPGNDAGSNDLPYSFLLLQSEGEIELDELTRVRFVARTLGEDRQEVTVYRMDDDYQYESIYHAERNRITPVYSRVFGVGHVMGAMPYAFGFSLIVYGAGWALRRSRKNGGPGQLES
jgi:hypothetical protein